jgi:hypothetical protein
LARSVEQGRRLTVGGTFAGFLAASNPDDAPARLLSAFPGAELIEESLV